MGTKADKICAKKCPSYNTKKKTKYWNNTILKLLRLVNDLG